MNTVHHVCGKEQTQAAEAEFYLTDNDFTSSELSRLQFLSLNL